MSRALRALVTIRRKLNNMVLRKAIQGYFPTVSPPKDGLLDFLEEVCWPECTVIFLQIYEEIISTLVR